MIKRPCTPFNLVVLAALSVGVASAQSTKRPQEPTRSATLRYSDWSSVKGLRRHIDSFLERREAWEKAVKAFQLKTGIKVEKEREAENGYLQAYLDWLEVRAFPNDRVDWIGFQREANMREAFGAKRPPNPNDAPIWNYVGPTNMKGSETMWFGPSPNTGRVSALAWHPTPGGFAKFYVGSPNGGVFQGQAGLTNFTSLSDDWPFLSVSSIAVHPQNPSIVLVGTGDFNGGKPFGGRGIRRSLDGGSTWEPPIDAEFPAARCVSQILIDPEDPKIVLASTGRGADPENTGAGRIYRSTNTGAAGSWSELNGANTPPSAIWSGMSVGALSPTTGRRFYYASSIDPQGKIYRSHTKGVSWEELPTPLTANSYLAVEVAASPITPNTVYVLAVRSNPAWNPANPNANPQFLRNIWRSKTAGKPAASWESILTNGAIDGSTAGTQDQYNFTQAYYDVHLTCSYRDMGGVKNDVLYVGLIDLAASVNADANNAAAVNFQLIGESFSNNPKIHNDQQSMAIRPGFPNEALVGCDGGLSYMTYSPGAGTWTFTQAYSEKLPITEFYKGAFFAPAGSPTVASRILGGMQDNQHTYLHSDGTSWKNAFLSGDGHGSFIVPVAVGGINAGELAYGSGYTGNFDNGAFNGLKYLTMFRTQDNWANNEFVGPVFNRSAGGANNAALNEPSRFFPPIAGSPTADEMYAGSNYLYRLTGYAQGTYNGVNWIRTGFNAAGTTPLTTAQLTSIGVAPSNTSVVYTGGLDGQIHRSNNKGAGGSWTRIDATLGVARPITHIAVDPTNPNRILVTLGGNTGERRRVWRCDDTTAAPIVWVSLAGPNNASGLRDVVANVAEFDPDLPATHMYVGTDIGFFYTRTGNQTGNNVIWLDGNTNQGLPKAPATSIKVLGNGSNANIYVATYGRGLWKVRYGDLP